MSQYIRYPNTGSGGGGVTSLDGLTGGLTLVAGTNITITDNGVNQITINATGLPVTFTAVGAVSNANGAIVTGSSQITLEPANSSFPGVLLASDWNTFNNKQDALIFSAPLVNTANTISIPQATAIADGYLDSADWVRFDAASTATTTGTPNSFSGFDSSGDLESIPGWLFDNVNNGAIVSLDADPSLGNTTINSLTSSFGPTSSSGNSMSAFNLTSRFDAANNGFSSGAFDVLTINQRHLGDGTTSQARSLVINQVSGDSVATGTINQLDTVYATSSIDSGFTVLNGRGLTFELNNGGVISGAYNLVDLNASGNSIGDQFVGLNLSANIDVVNNKFGLNLNLNGDVGGSLYHYNAFNGGDISGDFSSFNTSNDGAVTNNFFGLNISNNASASVAGGVFGVNFSNQATVANSLNSVFISNSGVITKGLYGLSVINSANVGDGAGGTDITLVNGNLNTGSVNGNIYGLNLFNSMPIIGNNTIYGLTLSNQGAGYNFCGVSLSNNANQSEQIKAFSFSSIGDSRTATLIDMNFNGAVTDDASGIRINFNGSSANQLTGLSINLNGAVDNNPQGVVGISSDSRIQVNATTILAPAQGFQIGNRIESLYTVAAGSPVTGTDSLGNNFAGDLIAQDDIAAGGFGIGWNSVGFIASVGIAAGKTIDKATIFLPAVSLPDPGFTTGGTISELNIISAYSPLLQGGTVSIGDAYVYKLDPVFGNLGSLATNAWGVWIGDTSVDNWFAKDVVIGGSTGKPVGSEKLTVNGSIASIGSTSGTFNQSAADTTTDYSIKWPAAQGGAGEALTNDGAGNLSWAASSFTPTAPTQQIILTGSGTYTTPSSPAPLYIKVKLSGGGGGGTAGGSGNTDQTNGGITTFGSSLLTANGGTAGTAGGGNGGAGGTASIAGGPSGIAISGGSGQGCFIPAVGTYSGGSGGSNSFGGAGAGSYSSNPGFSAAANSGAGGGGGGASGGNSSGAGGGAGGYVEALIISPSATYSYAVGAAGAGETGGVSAGGNGGEGIIIVEEYYQ